MRVSVDVQLHKGDQVEGLVYRGDEARKSVAVETVEARSIGAGVFGTLTVGGVALYFNSSKDVEAVIRVLDSVCASLWVEELRAGVAAE